MPGSSSSSGGARNHHFVPQFYLKGFATRRSKEAPLQVYDLKDKRSFSTRPRNVAAQRDYNRIEVDGVDPNVVETHFAVWEGEADQAFRRIIQSESIAAEEDFAFVIQLMARLFVAGPGFRSQRDDFMQRVATQMMHTIVSSEEVYESTTRRAREAGHVTGDHVPYEEMRSVVMGGGLTAQTSREELIRQEVTLWPEMIHVLARRHWSLMIAGGDAGEYVTSDRPAILQWTEPDAQRGFYPPGLGVGGTTITFPISKTLALRGTYEEEGRTVRASRQLVAALNTQATATAMRQVYCARDFPFWDLDQQIRPFSQSLAWQRHVAPE